MYLRSETVVCFYMVMYKITLVMHQGSYFFIEKNNPSLSMLKPSYSSAALSGIPSEKSVASRRVLIVSGQMGWQESSIFVFFTLDNLLLSNATRPDLDFKKFVAIELRMDNSCARKIHCLLDFHRSCYPSECVWWIHVSCFKISSLLVACGYHEYFFSAVLLPTIYFSNSAKLGHCLRYSLSYDFYHSGSACRISWLPIYSQAKLRFWGARKGLVVD